MPRRARRIEITVHAQEHAELNSARGDVRLATWVRDAALEKARVLRAEKGGDPGACDSEAPDDNTDGTRDDATIQGYDTDP